MRLPPQLEKLRHIKHAKIIGLVLTIILDILVISLAIHLSPRMGYYLMMVGLVAVTFTVPYIFGWREGKQLAVMGIGVFLLVGAINGPMVVYSAYSTQQPDPVSSHVHVTWFTKNYDYDAVVDGTYSAPNAWYRLENGTVEPYKNETGQTYRFKVTYYSNDTNAPTIRMGYARGLWGMKSTPALTATDPADTDYANGKDYHLDLTIPDPGIYSHWFAVIYGDSSLNTTVALGPLVGSQTENWGMYIPIGAVSMFCNIGLLFVIIVLLYWWIGTAKAKRRVWDEALVEKEEEAEAKGEKLDIDSLESKPFTCDQCGAPVGAEDNFCPKCGERFDGVEAEPAPAANVEGPDEPAGKEDPR